MTIRDQIRSIALSALAFAAHGALAQDGAAGQGAAASGQGEAASAATPSDVTRRRDQIDAHARATLDDLFDEDANAETLHDEAAGYAVVAATKAGFFVTGGTGIGVAVDKRTGARTYMRMGTGGLGLGLGAQRYDIVVLFETPVDLERFVAGVWDASASAQAAAGTDGVSRTSSFKAGVVFYTLTDKGLMAQADVSGTRFWTIERLN